jgi:hypothetical protein
VWGQRRPDARSVAEDHSPAGAVRDGGSARQSKLLLPARASARARLAACLATRLAQRYVADVRTAGGLKLSLEGAARNDRRVRFANVSLSAIDAKDDVALVTDSQGRMRYRLPDGDYLLRMAERHESRFTVRDGRWTTVRIRLP